MTVASPYKTLSEDSGETPPEDEETKCECTSQETSRTLTYNQELTNA